MLTSAYKLLITIGNALQSPFLLIIRLYWGWQFFLTGKGKLMNLDKITEFFASLNIPLPGLNAAMAGTHRSARRPAHARRAGVAPDVHPAHLTMVVAYLTADWDSAKQIFSDPDKFFTAGDAFSASFREPDRIDLWTREILHRSFARQEVCVADKP